MMRYRRVMRQSLSYRVRILTKCNDIPVLVTLPTQNDYLRPYSIPVLGHTYLLYPSHQGTTDILVFLMSYGTKDTYLNTCSPYRRRQVPCLQLLLCISMHRYSNLSYLDMWYPEGAMTYCRRVGGWQGDRRQVQMIQVGNRYWETGIQGQVTTSYSLQLMYV